MRVFFESRASKGSQKVHLQIGEDQGHLVCLLEETEGVHTQKTYLQVGTDSYDFWSAYMSELARLEKEEWDFQKRDLPRTSEVRDLHKQYSF